MSAKLVRLELHRSVIRAGVRLIALALLLLPFGLREFSSAVRQAEAQAATGNIAVLSATASSFFSDHAQNPPSVVYEPRLAFDGDAATFWHADSVSLDWPKWLQADLGQSYAVQQIGITFYSSGSHRGRDWQVQVSDDPAFVTSTTVLTVTNNALQVRTDTIAVPTAGRYLRFVFSAGGSSDFYTPTVSDIRLFGQPAHSLVRAIGATAINSYGGYGPMNVFDPATNTFWQAASAQTAFPKWLQADLGARYTVDQVQLDFYSTSAVHIAGAYTVTVSDDPAFGTATTLVSITGNTSQSRTHAIANPAAGRYVRFTFTACADAQAPFYCPTLTRIKIWGLWSRDVLTVTSASAINNFTGAEPAKAFDNNTATFWQAASSQTAFPKWLQADLGAEKAVAQVDLDFYTAANYPPPFGATDYLATDIEVQVSNDSAFASYVTAARVATNSQSSASLLFAPTTGRYVRIRFNACTLSGTQPFFCPTVVEADVYGQGLAQPASAAALTVRAAYASSYYGGDPTAATPLRPVPSLAFDGDASTYWHANDTSGATGIGNPKWLLADLGAAYAVSEVQLTFYSNGAHRATDYELQVSADPTFAASAVLARVQGNAAQTVTHRVNPVVGRFIRLWVTGSGSGDWWSPAVTQITVTGALAEGLPLPPGEGAPGSPLSLAPRSGFSPAQTLVQSFDVLFDGQVSATTFADWVESQGVTGVEFHSYMIGHEVLNTPQTAWNSYAGDDRLWTQRQVMLDKIAALHTRGIKAILYAAPYAASPDFYTRYPQWVARDAAYPGGYPEVFLAMADSQWTSATPYTITPYLFYQAIHPAADAPYVINGVTYQNYREYILAQFVDAVQDYGFDGVRVDFYGSPGRYYGQSFSGASNASRDIVDLTGELATSLKAIDPDYFVMVNEIPNADFDRIRNGIIANGSVDAYWLELWPHSNETGPTYADLAYQVAYTRLMAGQRGVVANFYPQRDVLPHCPGLCLPNGWTGPHLQYNFATPFAAGGAWGASSVDGHGSFTWVLPFDFAYMDASRNTTVHNWSAFYQTYGPYYAWSNDTYDFQVAGRSLLAAPTPQTKPNLAATLTERTDLRSGVRDASVLHLVNYPAPAGNTVWYSPTVSVPITETNLNVTVTVEAGRAVGGVWAAYPTTISGTEIVTQTLGFVQNGQALSFTVPSIGYYQMVVIELTSNQPRPDLVTLDPATTDSVVPPYDVGANLIHPSPVVTTTVFDESSLLAITPYWMATASSGSYRLITTTYQIDTSTAYSGTSSYRISPASGTPTGLAGNVHFIGGDLPIRFDLTRYSQLSFAWKGTGNSVSIGFVAINLDDPKQTRRVFYYAGTINSDTLSSPYLPTIWIQVSSTVPSNWTEVNRSILSDLQGQTGWTNIAVSSLFLGSGIGNGYFDLVRVGP